MKFIEKLKKHEEQFSSLSTAVVCVMCMLVITFWSYEEHVPASFMSILHKLAAAAAVLMWVYASFMRGLVRRTGFAMFTALYFTIPSFIAAAAEKAEADPKTLDVNLMFAGDWARLIGIRPLENMPVLRELDPLTAAVIFSSVCIVIFIIGMFVGNVKPEGGAQGGGELTKD